MIYRFVVDGGTWMLPILAVSVVGFAFVLERLGYWLRLAVSRDGKLRKRLLAGETPPPGATVTDPVARVLVDAVRRPDDLGIASARAERILRESKSHLGILRLVAGTAALGGLLVTSFSIREAFRTTTDPARLGTAIANSLHATILGLLIFLGAFVATSFFHALTARLAAELDDHLDEAAKIQRRPALSLAPAPAPEPEPSAPRGVSTGYGGPSAAALANVLGELGPDDAPGGA